MTGTTVRRTKSVCPECLRLLEAEVVERGGKVYLEKTCPDHGPFSLLVGADAAYYRDLNDYYFSVMKDRLPQKDYIVHLTNACNLDCPICLADANGRGRADLSVDDLRGFLQGRRGNKIDLMGAEPTVRTDLAEIIRLITDSGNIAALHTNGILLADEAYLGSLVKAGLSEVHLQFDGFDDAVYEKIRGRRLLETKLKALENLEKHNVATDIVATVVRGVNESEMGRILEYGAGHAFVREVFFIGCRFLGKAKDDTIDRCLMPDELIDLLEEQSGGRLRRRDVFRFQKLYFALLSAFAKRKCFYIHHYMIARTGSSYVPVSELLDLASLEGSLDRYRSLRSAGKKRALPYLFWSLLRHVLNRRMLPLLADFASYALPFVNGFALSLLSRRAVLIGYISACDAWSLDYDIARHCGKGALSVELGMQDTGAIDNVLRDRMMQ